MNTDPNQTPTSPTPGTTPRRSWWWRRTRKQRLALSLTSLVLGLVIMAIPFAPWILFHVFRPDPSLPYATQLANRPDLLPNIKQSDRDANQQKPQPDGNRLVIPKIGVDVNIVEGQDERSLFRGIWHFPASSTPDKGGNTVLTGHRFQYLAGPRTLYLLDQMQVNDVIIVYWGGKEYDYKIVERKIVNPDAVDILDNTQQPRLTVFTCTPVFSTKQRLVLFAEPLTT